MSDLIWLSDAQMRRIGPYFPLSHGVFRVNGRRVISGIIFLIRNGLRWRDAPAEYGPHKTIYNRFIRWSRMGGFNKIFASLTVKGGKLDRMMIDAFPKAKALPGDKGSDANWFREALANRKIEACLPSKINCTVHIPHAVVFYRQRHKIENMSVRPKDWHRIRTRYDRRARTFVSTIWIAAALASD